MVGEDRAWLEVLKEALFAFARSFAARFPRFPGLNKFRLRFPEPFQVDTPINPPAREIVFEVRFDSQRCVGTGACAYTCPYNVIELDGAPTRPFTKHIGACHGCRECERICPLDAITVYESGKDDPKHLFPELDPFYQAEGNPGFYVVGDASRSKVQVINAANMGHRAVSHAISTGLRPGLASSKGADLEVLIAGAGPAGLAAALAANEAGLSYRVCERETEALSLIRAAPKGLQYPPGPEGLDSISLFDPFEDVSREALIQNILDTIDEAGVEVSYDEEVLNIDTRSSVFEVATSRGSHRALVVILAPGRRVRPNRLGCPGDDLDKVHYRLRDPDEFCDKRILVLGRSDYIIEAAFQLVDFGRGNLVALSRLDEVSIKESNKARLEEYIGRGLIQMAPPCIPTEIRPSSVLYLDPDTGEQNEVYNDYVVVLLDPVPSRIWLEKLGVTYTRRPADFDIGDTMDMSFSRVDDRS